MYITQQRNKLTKRCCNVVTTFDITHFQYLKKHILIEYFTYLCIISLIFNYFSRSIYIPTRNIFGQTFLQCLSQTSTLQHSINVVTTLCYDCSSIFIQIEGPVGPPGPAGPPGPPGQAGENGIGIIGNDDVPGEY